MLPAPLSTIPTVGLKLFEGVAPQRELRLLQRAVGISKPKMSGVPEPCTRPLPSVLARALHGSPTDPGKEALVTGTFVVGSTTDVNDDRSDRAYNAETPNPKCRR